MSIKAIGHARLANMILDWKEAKGKLEEVKVSAHSKIRASGNPWVYLVTNCHVCHTYIAPPSPGYTERVGPGAGI